MIGLEKCCITSACLQWLYVTQVSEPWPVGLGFFFFVLFCFLFQPKILFCLMFSTKTCCRILLRNTATRHFKWVSATWKQEEIRKVFGTRSAICMALEKVLFFNQKYQYFSYFLTKTSWGYSLEVPQQDASNEYSQVDNIYFCPEIRKPCTVEPPLPPPMSGHLPLTAIFIPPEVFSYIFYLW